MGVYTLNLSGHLIDARGNKPFAADCRGGAPVQPHPFSSVAEAQAWLASVGVSGDVREGAAVARLLVGMAVELVQDVAPRPLGRFPAGTRGKVVHVEKMATPGMPVAVVKLDQHFPCLAEWDNELQVFRPEDGEVCEELFRAVDGGPL